MLLQGRMEMALLSKRFKSQIEDPDREIELLEKVKSGSSRLLRPEFIERIFLEILRESKELQQQDYQLAAFQGEHGAFSEQAAGEWDVNLIPVPCPSFADVFERTLAGDFDYGIVPVENTLGGSVGEVNRLLIQTGLKVVGALDLPIHQCLLALPGTDHREIRKVYSHPQALAQTRRFLERNKLEAVSFPDTAGAARMLAEKKPEGSAAIAGRLAAERYQLEIIKENIEDLETNRTRFLVLAREPNPEGGEKCSIVFSTEHKAGTLFRVLEVFARADVNLTRIESMAHEPGNYAFLLDFIGSDQAPPVVNLLHQVEGLSTGFKLLGCYREVKI
jgi:prephenate dehydratase/chorismate mutase/prephenate dehydratase